MGKKKSEKKCVTFGKCDTLGVTLWSHELYIIFTAIHWDFTVKLLLQYTFLVAFLVMMVFFH